MQKYLGICLDGSLLRPYPPDNHEGEQGNIQRMQGGVCYKNSSVFVQLLLEKKCDLDLCDEINGNTPIMLATSLNQVNRKELIMSKLTTKQYLLK